MTVNLGRLRLRIRCRWCASRAPWCVKTVFDKGSVYRVRVGWLLVTCLADMLTERQRTMAREDAYRYINGPY